MKNEEYFYSIEVKIDKKPESEYWFKVDLERLVEEHLRLKGYDVSVEVK